jgi:hypothetical protein
MSWNVDLGYKTKSITGGLPENFGATLNPADRSSLIYGIDPHTYNTISFGGKIDFNEGILNEASMKQSFYGCFRFC